LLIVCATEIFFNGSFCDDPALAGLLGHDVAGLAKTGHAPGRAPQALGRFEFVERFHFGSLYIRKAALSGQNETARLLRRGRLVDRDAGIGPAPFFFGGHP
jgi:hypothetical protein